MVDVPSLTKLVPVIGTGFGDRRTARRRWVDAQKPASVDDIIQCGLVDDFVNALDLPIIPKTKLLGALKPQVAMMPGTVMGTAC